MANTQELDTSFQTQDAGDLKWLPILMYHHVVPERHPSLEHVAVTCDEFEQQMKFLKDHGYESVHLVQAARSLTQGKGPVERPVVITFDDGYLDVYLHAFPILRKYGFTAHLFLVSSHLDQEAPGAHRFGDRWPLLGITELREMVGYGISFGSHSVTHRRLTELSDQEAWAEVQESKIALERILELPIDSFSYPHGSSTAELQQATREAGYLTACGIEQREHELYNLSRIDASRCQGADLRWQAHISGLYFRLRQRNELRKLKDLLVRLKPNLSRDGKAPTGCTVDEVFYER